MKNNLILAIVFALTLVACASNDKSTTGNNGGTPVPGGTEIGGKGTNIDAGKTPITDIWGDPRSLLSRNVIYFDFNSAQIRNEDMGILNAHAKYLADNPGAKVRLEGHADERGSREDNVALSENRTMSARRLMTFQGMNTAQTEIIAYGEERPAEFCQSENCWSANRRVEIIYESK